MLVLLPVYVHFGFTNFKLVSPKPQWPSEKLFAVAVDAKNIVENIKVYILLREALSDTNYSIKKTARLRDMSKQFSDNSKIISEIKGQKINDSIGVVFEKLRTYK